MERLQTLSDTEIKMGFVASCVEAVAKRLGTSYKEVYERMKNVNLINAYILPFYDVIHTESRDNVTESIIDTLTRWEKGGGKR